MTSVERDRGPTSETLRKRVRMELDGGYMDVTLDADASPETVAALRDLGQAALAHVKKREEAAS